MPGPKEFIGAVEAAILAGQPPAASLPRPPSTSFVEYACWRFLEAWRGTGRLQPDHAVLLRQVLRWSERRLRLGKVPPFLHAVTGGPTSAAEEAGISINGLGEVEAVPWRPAWAGNGSQPHHGTIDGKPEMRRPDERIPAEPYLPVPWNEADPKASWSSQAQKEATWWTLTAPRRSTTLITLPTGAGKSQCFQVLPVFGTGLTLVIVPTVALAIDQARAAASLFADQAHRDPLLAAKVESVRPSYFAADDHADEVLDDLAARRTRLLFTSPEACVGGRLKPFVHEAVATGYLENLVFDEAHMIASWGIYFRPEFQLLSLFQRKWLSDERNGLRTYLFSATYSPATRDMLQSLYGGEQGNWREFVSQRLRPEPCYYVADFRKGTAVATEGTAPASSREDAVMEALWHLPRPAIVYTTEVKHTERLLERIKAAGFGRADCFHGETSSKERRRLIEAWREDRIDLMVATSAFGLGVDKGDVRAVIHACLPESIDRYYQEVGRSGRDGASSSCLLIPAPGDQETAEGLGPKLLLPKTIAKRWQGLWDTAQPTGAGNFEYELRVDARPEHLVGARTYKEHVRWNKRLLLQLQRSGHLELLDLRYEPPAVPDEDGSEWLRVRLKFPPATGDVARLVEQPRQTEFQTMKDELAQMVRLLAKDAPCFSWRFATVYGRESTIRVCGGCPACRAAGREPRPADRCPELEVPPVSDTQPMLQVVTEAPPREGAASDGAWTTALRKILSSSRARRFLCRAEDREWLQGLLDRADQNRKWWYRIDTTEGGRVRLGCDEVAVVFHGRHRDEPALELKQGKVIHHVFEDGAALLDSSGRWPLESEGATRCKFGGWDLVH